MVAKTRTRNKNVHPGALVMTEAAKVKAGIKPAKSRKKRTTKDAKIRELEEEITRLKHPDDSHPSKEPLVSIFPSISYRPILTRAFQFLDDTGSGDDAEVGTDPDSNSDTPPGGKRKHNSQNQRCVTPNAPRSYSTLTVFY